MRQLSIQLRREISDADRQRLFEWEPDVFRGEDYGIQWRTPDMHVIGYLDDQPVTHVGVVAHRVRVADEQPLVGGIGGVVTVGQHQGQGLAAQCLLRAQEYVREELGVEFGFLFCQDRFIPYYGRFGWRLLKDPVTIEQPGGRRLAPVHAMVLEFSRHWPDGPVDLESLPW